MARRARVTFPGIPHHVRQRGNRRLNVFRDDEDRLLFIDLLAAYKKAFGFSIWAYTLMTNHVHLITVPEGKESFSAAMRDLFSDYALAFNKRYDYVGHLWEQRFRSSALGPDHLWNAVRYVERNPVRAGMVVRAEDYRWSSAAYHCGLRATDPLVSPDSPLIGAIDDWSAWLRIPNTEAEMDLLRRNTRTGRPSGSKEFVQMLEHSLGRPIAPRKPGRKGKGVKAGL